MSGIDLSSSLKPSVGITPSEVSAARNLNGVQYNRNQVRYDARSVIAAVVDDHDLLDSVPSVKVPEVKKEFSNEAANNREVATHACAGVIYKSKRDGCMPQNVHICPPEKRQKWMDVSGNSGFLLHLFASAKNCPFANNTFLGTEIISLKVATGNYTVVVDYKSMAGTKSRSPLLLPLVAKNPFKVQLSTISYSNSDGPTTEQKAGTDRKRLENMTISYFTVFYRKKVAGTISNQSERETRSAKAQTLKAVMSHCLHLTAGFKSGMRPPYITYASSLPHISHSLSPKHTYATVTLSGIDEGKVHVAHEWKPDLREYLDVLQQDLNSLGQEADGDRPRQTRAELH
ncbi:hypothetical protein DFH08DRAFT_808484 [Mycena albidolilacea]|uniref:Uncharacterized protein n=1 Tax=Mycena albidolilacea TaxID=1033008 RepID=A0AAD7ER74_9AGAR|nr:hypothetical protein DFH08DRAFT_808484 [Mycena albidolilacea]